MSRCTCSNRHRAQLAAQPPRQSGAKATALQTLREQESVRCCATVPQGGRVRSLQRRFSPHAVLTRAAWNGRLENLPTCRHECRRYAVTPAFQPAGSETFQSRVRATVEKCPPPQACSLEFEGWSLFGFWCLVFGVFSGPVAQRLEQGTHNPLVLGSNPSRPTTPSGKFQNPNAKLQTGASGHGC